MHACEPECESPPAQPALCSTYALLCGHPRPPPALTSLAHSADPSRDAAPFRTSNVSKRTARRLIVMESPGRPRIQARTAGPKTLCRMRKWKPSPAASRGTPLANAGARHPGHTHTFQRRHSQPSAAETARLRCFPKKVPLVLEEPTTSLHPQDRVQKVPDFSCVCQMGFCTKKWRRVIPEAPAKEGKQILVPRRSRVNGWSKPLHSFQAAAWIMFLVLAFASFFIFIPLLPQEWKYIAYIVTGGLFFFHFIVHLIAMSLDPAEDSVRLKKSYTEPLPTFDRSKHAHVIQNQYCHLCQVPVSLKAKHCSACNKCISGFDHHCKWLNNCVGTRNYWYFFSSVASASAGLLCLIVILLYIFTQYFLNPEELRTDPQYQSVSRKNTWLLFLPLFPVRTSTPVVLGIGVSMLLLDIMTLVMLGHLLIFHLYLMAKKMSTFEYMTQGRLRQDAKTPEAKKGLSIQIELPQEADEDLSPSARGKGKHKQFLRFPWCQNMCSLSTIHPKKSSPPKQTVVDPNSSASGVKSEELPPPLKDPSQSFVVTIHPENSSSLLKLRAEPLGTSLKCRGRAEGWV
ncbi:palmitoyltransferase ZDHHC11 isoform X2 [Equus asinus]|uniref:palmitoyltransferase ZDHHC11 isoform X2 n=1 Tax=Equus asinus TaxID=9793 RepID=UPI0038F6BC38